MEMYVAEVVALSLVSLIAQWVVGQALAELILKTLDGRKFSEMKVVYIDYTCVIQGYTGDPARMFCIGELTHRMVKAFEDTLLIQSEIIKAIKPGIAAEEPYLLAVIKNKIT
jgi:Xaa-Pro aminopeptidase